MPYTFKRDAEATEEEFESVSYAVAICDSSNEIVAITYDEEMAEKITNALNKNA